jgi:hypothetical protein
MDRDTVVQPSRNNQNDRKLHKESTSPGTESTCGNAGCQLFPLMGVQQRSSVPKHSRGPDQWRWEPSRGCCRKETGREVLQGVLRLFFLSTFFYRPPVPRQTESWSVCDLFSSLTRPSESTSSLSKNYRGMRIETRRMDRRNRRGDCGRGGTAGSVLLQVISTISAMTS